MDASKNGSGCDLADGLGRLLARISRSYEAFAAEARGWDAAGAAGTSRDALELALAALRQLNAPEAERQVLVIGPTQAGKSTLVNRIMDAEVAGVSPRAGFTTQPARFRIEGAAGIGALGESRCPAGDSPQSGQGVASSGFTPLTPPAGDECAGIEVWDTPDFDSLAAHEYRAALLPVLARADLLVCVLTREKYADLAVWRMLDCVAPLGRALLLCLNKMTADVEPVVRESLAQQLRQRPAVAATVVDILSYPWESPAVDQVAAAAELRRRVRAALSGTEREGWPRGVARLLRQHWERWTRPIAAQHAAEAEWTACVTQELDASAEAYSRDVLDHPDRNVAFARTIQVLLEMLEVPGVSRVAQQARALATWPWRRLAEFVWRRAARGGGSIAPDAPRYLAELSDHLLLRLERAAASRRIASQRGAPIGREWDAASAAGAAFWAQLEQRLSTDGPIVGRDFQTAAAALAEPMQADIRRAAESLYARLRERPALLNSLRAARVTADAASLILAVKSAGLGATDLLLAPAVFGVVSLLTESAVGSYVGAVAAGLRLRQAELFRTHVLDERLRPQLIELAKAVRTGDLEPITPSELADATNALQEWSRVVGE